MANHVQRTIRQAAALGALALLAAVALPLAAADRLTVHEWGTFTCLQDETGRAIPGVNTDDEALPRFVHRLADFLIVPPSEAPMIYYKGIPMLHPHVTMRLETPVIYFYPPAGQKEPLELNARVQFHGGWLSEYYPNASVRAGPAEANGFRPGPISAEAAGSLEWNRLRVGVDAKGPETDFRVWLAPAGGVGRRGDSAGRRRAVFVLPRRRARRSPAARVSRSSG